MYCYKSNKNKKNISIQLLASGSMLNEAIKASVLLEKDWKISSTIWSVTSYSELHKDAEDKHRWNNLHPNSQQKISFLEKIGSYFYLSLFFELLTK